MMHLPCRKGHSLAVVLPAVLAAALTGCDIGTNPLILDGSVSTARFAVDMQVPPIFEPSFEVEDSVDLEPLFETAEEVDSVKFYNLTFHSTGSEENLATRLTGTVFIDEVPVLHLTDVQLSTFYPGRSIFDAAPGFSHDDAGVARLRQALAPGASDRTVNMRIDMTADSHTLRFTLQAKVYTQVFVSP